jgi:hypothetical protein
VTTSASPITTAVIEATIPLPGVRAASALYPWGNRLVALQDDAWDMVFIDPHTGACEHWPLQGLGEALPKPEKPDFEAVCALTPDHLALFGSGLTAKRRSIVLVDLVSRRIKVIDAAPLYQAITDELGESPNIEGAAKVGMHLYLTHRGTGIGPNQWLVLPVWWLTNLDPETPVHIPDMVGSMAIPTSTIDGVPLGVTDIAATSRGLYLLGAAERTANAYDDGEIAGAAIGWCEEPGDEIVWTPIREADGSITHHKPEGLVIDPGGCHAWAVTDPDDADQPALLLRLRLTDA